jgi:hypothetical protein
MKIIIDEIEFEIDEVKLLEDAVSVTLKYELDTLGHYDLGDCDFYGYGMIPLSQDLKSFVYDIKSIAREMIKDYNIKN